MKDSVQKIADRLMKKYTEEQLENFTVGSAVPEDNAKNVSAPRVLTLRLKGKWWDQIASGEKTVELRLATDYWRKRLIGQHYDEIHIWNGYPPKSCTQKLLRRKWECVAKETIVHEEFGPKPVDVFCISVGTPVQ